jgi:predicted TIM-barrel enzyme
VEKSKPKEKQLGKTYTVAEIQSRVQRTIDSGHPVIGSSASSGLLGAASEAGGADFIVLYSTGLSRVMGQGTRIVGDANTITFDMHEEVWAVVEDTPIIAGLDANDPYNWDHRKLLQRFKEVGTTGVIHNPMIGIYGAEYAQMRTAAGQGFEREVEFTRVAVEMGFYTMAYTWTIEETIAMTEAGTHCVIAHVGGTGGGLESIPHKTVEECVPLVNAITDAARSVNPDVLSLAHGGPFMDPESVKNLYRYTDVMGYVGASSIERTPVEDTVMDLTRAYKSVSLGRKS